MKKLINKIKEFVKKIKTTASFLWFREYDLEDYEEN